MDGQLRERLDKLADQIDKLKEVERVWLQLEGNRKALLAKLTLKAQGKSFAEREAVALASEDWDQFAIAHADAENEYLHERRRYELQLKAYDAAHLSLKVEVPAIKRQVGA